MPGKTTTMFPTSKLRDSAAKRSRRGNILISLAVILFLLAAIAVGLIILSGIFTQQRVGERAEKMAMQAARLMNNSDWTGEMNNMLAASRELVFDDRNTYKTALRSNPELQPLAKHFLDESRASAEFTIAQRDLLAKVTIGNLITFETASNNDRADQGLYGLPGVSLVKTDLPQIVDFQLGYMKGIDSNVQSPDGNLSLLNYDQSQTYVDSRTHLYYGNVILRLPDPDSDLSFKICPLAAPVRGTIAPARLASGDAFQRTFDLVKDRETNPGLCDQLSTAARLNVVINLKGADGQVTQPMVINVTAASNGGCPRP